MTLSAFSQHAPHPYFAADGGELLVGGRRISDIAHELGRDAVLRLRPRRDDAQGPGTARRPAARSRDPLRDEGQSACRRSCDISAVWWTASTSRRRAKWTSRSRPACNPGEISFAGPGKSVAELERAVAAGIVINMESELEMRRIAEIARRTGRGRTWPIRVNPDFELKTSGMKMARRPEAVRRRCRSACRSCCANSPGCRCSFDGFHIYSGSQNLRPEIICGLAAEVRGARDRTRTARAVPGAAAQSRRRLRHSVFPGRAAAGPRTDRRQPA